MSEFRSTPIEWIKTDEGFMIPIFKDWEWEEKGLPHDVKMVYASTMDAGTSKGPIVHSERTSIMTAVSGWAKVEIIHPDFKDPMSITLRDPWASHAVMIPPGMPARYVCGAEEPCVLISLPNIAWTPNNDDSTKYDGWDGYFSKVKA